MKYISRVCIFNVAGVEVLFMVLIVVLKSFVFMHEEIKRLSNTSVVMNRKRSIKCICVHIDVENGVVGTSE